MEPKEVGRAVEHVIPTVTVGTQQRAERDTPGVSEHSTPGGGRETRVSHRGSAPATVVSGLLAGTRLWTMEGDLPVQYLSPGDRIITRDSGMVRLGSVTLREVSCVTVRIKAGSQGHTRPEDDLVLPATQPVLVRDWRAQALFGASQVMVPISRLVDGQFVTLGARETLRLIELRFDRPHILYADGIEIACATAAPQPAA
ncbi:Hint domain-containing protein [Marinovum sp.]|nr:Hint domain-containing protein [Marinovum sp.]